MPVDLKTISELREKTGAGIGDCKAVLEEAGGEIEKAVELLRKKGEIKAAKKQDRSTKEGVIAIKSEDKKAAVVALACETDFVSRGDDFKNAVSEMAEKLFNLSEEEFKSWADERIKELVLKIGENIQLTNYGIYAGEVVGTYIHSNKKVAGIVVLSGGSRQIADDIAMQVAAMSPRFLNPESIQADILEKEKEIYREQLKNENKPEAIWDKIIGGKLAKFYEENCLTNQIFIKDDAKKIMDILGSAQIVSFDRIQT